MKWSTQATENSSDVYDVVEGRGCNGHNRRSTWNIEEGRKGKGGKNFTAQLNSHHSRVNRERDRRL